MSLLLITFKLYFNFVTFVLAIIININANNKRTMCVEIRLNCNYQDERIEMVHTFKKSY